MSRRVAAPAAASLFAIALALSACTGTSSADDEGLGVVTFPTVPWEPADENTAIGGDDPEISGEFPETIYVADLSPIERTDMLAAESGGNGDRTYAVIDTETGVVRNRITTGRGFIQPVVGQHEWLAPVVAYEGWRPRGSRGDIAYNLAWYEGDMLSPEELALPSYYRLVTSEGAHITTADGRYMVAWDNGLYGIRAVDLKERKETGALQLVGCGPFTWVKDRDLYSICEREKAIVQVRIGDDGSLAEISRARVLPSDFVNSRERTASYSQEANVAVLVNELGEAYRFDFSDGLPKLLVESLGNIGDDNGRLHSVRISNDGTKAAIAYTDGIGHPNSGDTNPAAKIVLWDLEAFTRIAEHTVADLDFDEKIGSFEFGADGTLFVLGEGKSDEEKEADGGILVALDPASGAVQKRTPVMGSVGGLSGLIAPMEPTP